MSTWSRLIDVVGASLGLVLFLPILVMIAIAVGLTSPGPSIVQTRRRRKDGSIVSVYRFRTCYINSTEETIFGRLLREFSLDLLPACLSILQGNLSFRDLWDMDHP